MLVDGKWMGNWQPVQATDANGGFIRQISSFRHWITPDGAAGPTGEEGFKAETGRYHWYVALADVWRYALPDTDFAVPDGPFFGHGFGRQ
jgi:putative glutathione S-transferase